MTIPTPAAAVTTPQQDEEVCKICRDTLNLPIKLSCGHVYCFFCIKQAYEVVKECPYCRTTILSQEIYAPYMLVTASDGAGNTDNGSVTDSTSNTEGASTSKWVWLYESKDDRWWRYDPKTCEALERAYQDHIANIYLRDEDEEEMPPLIFTFYIGNTNYCVDFDLMIQYQTHNPGLKRKIKRIGSDGDNIITATIKGVAGIRVKNVVASSLSLSTNDVETNV